MYEEGGGPAYGENNTEAKEEEEKEAYLLGKEYVPKGQERHVGDFAEAAAMGAVLEKASTRGATIGVGEAGGAAGASSRGGDAVVHLKDDNEEQIKDDDGRSEFNREFHLRHEDREFEIICTCVSIFTLCNKLTQLTVPYSHVCCSSKERDAEKRRGEEATFNGESWLSCKGGRTG